LSKEVRRVEVIISVQRRWRWSVAEKIRLVEDTLQPGMSVSFVARKHGISPNLLFKWKQRMAAGGREAARVDDEVIGAKARQLEERIHELKRLLGRKTPRGRDPKRGAHRGARLLQSGAGVPRTAINRGDSTASPASAS
jgi:transposase-like protein